MESERRIAGCIDGFGHIRLNHKETDANSDSLSMPAERGESRSTVLSPNGKLRTLSEACSCLLESERLFVHQLSNLCKLLLRPLTAEVEFEKIRTIPSEHEKTRPLADHLSVRICFDDLEQLLFLHRGFCEDLEAALDETSFLSCLKVNSKWFSFYIHYSRALVVAETVIQRELRVSERLSTFVKSRSRRIGSENLFDFLSEPLGRLPFYAEVMRGLPELEAVVDTVSSTLLLCVNCKVPAETVEQVLDVENLFMPTRLNLVHADRKLLRHGFVLKKRVLHLFNDVLLISVILSESRLQLQSKISLANLVVTDTSDPDTPSYSFALEARGRVCARLEVAKADEKDIWISSIRHSAFKYSHDRPTGEPLMYKTSHVPSKPILSSLHADEEEAISAFDYASEVELMNHVLREQLSWKTSPSDFGSEDAWLQKCSEIEAGAGCERRYELILSLRNEETRYCDSMRILWHSFAQPLLHEVGKRRSRPGSRQVALFLNSILSLWRVHQRFVLRIERVLMRWSPRICFGSVMLDFLPSFRIYGEFVEGYGDAMKWIAADDVRDFIEGCEDGLEDGCFPFTCFVELPKHRVARYAHMMEVLYTMTPVGHTDRGLLEQAKKDLRTTEKFLRHRFVEGCRRRELQELENSFIKRRSGRGVKLVVSGRRLLKKGRLAKLSTTRNTAESLTFHLCNDRLFYSEDGSHGLRLRREMNVETLSVGSVEANHEENEDGDAQMLIEVRSAQKNFVICAFSVSEREEWFSALVEAIIMRKHSLVEARSRSQTYP